MPLPAGSLSAFFAFHPTVKPRDVAEHCDLTSKRVGDLRGLYIRATAHDVAQLSIAFGVPYDTVLQHLDARAGDHLAGLRRQLELAQDAIPQDANA